MRLQKQRWLASAATHPECSGATGCRCCCSCCGRTSGSALSANSPAVRDTGDGPTTIGLSFHTQQHDHNENCNTGATRIGLAVAANFTLIAAYLLAGELKDRKRSDRFSTGCHRLAAAPQRSIVVLSSCWCRRCSCTHHLQSSVSPAAAATAISAHQHDDDRDAADRGAAL